jgi:3-dehydroquinate dehydratase I
METKTKICVSIGKVPFDAITSILSKVEMAEIRLDLARLDEKEIRAVFSAHDNLIATCREGEYSDMERARLMEVAVENGAAWIDIEADAEPRWRKSMINLVKSSGSKLIISRHFYAHTPSSGELKKSVDEMFEMEADLVKIASHVNHPSEAAALLGLYSLHRKIVAIGMGPLGIITRVAAPFLGAPFTFASLGDDLMTAGGQIEYKEMAALIERISSYG